MIYAIGWKKIKIKNKYIKSNKQRRSLPFLFIFFCPINPDSSYQRKCLLCNLLGTNRNRSPHIFIWQKIRTSVSLYFICTSSEVLCQLCSFLLVPWEKRKGRGKERFYKQQQTRRTIVKQKKKHKYLMNTAQKNPKSTT